MLKLALAPLTCILIFSCYSALCNRFFDRYTRAKAAQTSKESLEYGESCSWGDEWNRIRAEKKITEIFSSGTISNEAAFRATAHELEFLTATTDEMCRSEKNLQCNVDSGTCRCANPKKYSSTDVTMIWENDACQLTKGSTCDPDKIGTDFSCVAGTSCKIKTSLVSSHSDNVKSELIRTGQRPGDAISTFRSKHKAIVEGVFRCL
jgi:hypothetical protein